MTRVSTKDMTDEEKKERKRMLQREYMAKRREDPEFAEMQMKSKHALFLLLQCVISTGVHDEFFRSVAPRPRDARPIPIHGNCGSTSTT